MSEISVFTDLHHESLYQSLQLLFEKRLGWRLFRPAGLDWFQKGYWRIAELYNNAPDTISQFLELRGVKEFPYIPPFTGKPLNKVKEDKKDYFIIEAKPYDHRVVTTEQFFAMEINLVVATHPLHIESFRRLCNEHKNRPKLIYQIGNTWNIEPNQVSLLDGILASAIVNQTSVPTLTYHQEFDLNTFHYEPPREVKKIKTFLHCFDIYKDAQLFYLLETSMKDFIFKAHGATSRDGVITGTENLAEAMFDSTFIWHLKHEGDGFGHILHNAFAVGRPPIVKREYYRGKLGEALMEDGVTCLEIDNLAVNQVIDKIREFSKPERYSQLSKNAHKRFREVVNYDVEEQTIRQFLDKII